MGHRDVQLDSAALAAPLAALASMMAEHGFHAVLIGGAAAVLHGVQENTGDLDFVFVDSVRQRSRLGLVATSLGASLTRPFFHRSLRWAMHQRSLGLQADFLLALDGYRSLTGLFRRATWLEVAGVPVHVAAMGDVMRCRQASARAKDAGRCAGPSR